ncbi:hypothetical protein COT42_07520 [Candidatus Saganbacteria bacterium CG08_land_8_20_14_0_20_45_16]|uniref:HEPN domain-containing protein n=1 Tax=Candidatus Saganbacteria bacterium CG08_land_8_20_14_0_20_45_16 TaxID=2014293 RepID=A0A2H0XUR5_UNCSA|nr:MAG: hypothetical protein COT42_07520 [Candidatus Saganbacteria bacterium CG08_land_8_20_14_0_20_45_16]
MHIFQKSEFPPRTHSFKFLVEQLNLPQKFLAEIIDLEKYYMSLRYPDISDMMPYENCSKEDAEMGIARVEMVQATIKRKIQ